MSCVTIIITLFLNGENMTMRKNKEQDDVLKEAFYSIVDLIEDLLQHTNLMDSDRLARVAKIKRLILKVKADE